MNLTIQDAAALLFTGLGSQREIARRLGITHQKVGRVLRAGQPGGYDWNSRMMSDPALINLFSHALQLHGNHAALIAHQQGLPFNWNIPALAQRMFFQQPGREHVRGDRVEIKHMHWMSDALRDAWLTSMRKTGRFYAVSVGSIVNWTVYSGQADQRAGDAFARGIQRSEEQTKSALQIYKKIEEKQAQGLVQTRYFSMDKKALFPWDATLQNIRDTLDEKHAPATGEPGTAFATRYLLQIDTRNGKDTAYRSTHPIPAAQAKPRKARRSRGGAGRPRTNK